MVVVVVYYSCSIFVIQLMREETFIADSPLEIHHHPPQLCALDEPEIGSYNSPVAEHRVVYVLLSKAFISYLLTFANKIRRMLKAA